MVGLKALQVHPQAVSSCQCVAFADCDRRRHTRSVGREEGVILEMYMQEFPNSQVSQQRTHVHKSPL